VSYENLGKYHANERIEKALPKKFKNDLFEIVQLFPQLNVHFIVNKRCTTTVHKIWKRVFWNRIFISQ